MPLLTEFTPDFIQQPVDSYRLEEGEVAVAEYSDELPYITTFGLWTCKAITLYNPARKRGLLAHLSWTRDPNVSLAKIAEVYDDSFEATEVGIVQTLEHPDHEYWPTIPRIASYFASYNPLGISVNYGNTGGRAIALSLLDGKVTEIDAGIMGCWGGVRDISLNRSLPK